jgi:nicotinamide mononucleotide adenylyltransferase
MMHETGVIHGRFQVFHNDHMKYVLSGKSRCRHLFVGITNPDPTLTARDEADPHRSLPLSNPLTYLERYMMIRAFMQEADVETGAFSIVPFPINFPELYRYYVPLDAIFFLSIYDDWGRRKLARFREMGLRTEILSERGADDKGISASTIRRHMIEGKAWKHLVPSSTASLLEEWHIPERLRRLRGIEKQAGQS